MTVGGREGVGVACGNIYVLISPLSVFVTLLPSIHLVLTCRIPISRRFHAYFMSVYVHSHACPLQYPLQHRACRSHLTEPARVHTCERVQKWGKKNKVKLKRREEEDMIKHAKAKPRLPFSPFFLFSPSPSLRVCTCLHVCWV